MRARRLCGIGWIWTASLLAQPAPTPSLAAPPVGADAVWAPPADFLTRFHAACDAFEGERFGRCFVEQMRKAGAPPAATAFAGRTGDTGYLRAFRAAGPVDIAFVEYPLRANENQGIWLVNGTPPSIDVDDLSLLDRRTLESNPEYSALARSFPNVELFAGPRNGARGPFALRLTTGGQRFLVTYRLRDGCHACRALGEADLRFDFDVEGRFRGAEVQRVRRTYAAGERD